MFDIEHQERKVKDMRKTTLAIYRWDDNKAWVYVGCTPISEQAENIINNFNITGTDPRAIADEVDRKLQRRVERRKAAWA